MLNWWRSRADEKSPSATSKSTGRPSGFGLQTDASVVSPSVTSKPSLGSGGKLSRRDSAVVVTPDRIPILGVKDVVVVGLEMLITFCGQTIRKRKSDAHTYHSQLWKTGREIEIDLLFVQGFAAIGSLLAGFLADGYCGNFYMAFGSIMIIFFMVSCLYLEQVLILRLSTNPYAEMFTQLAAVGHFVIHATGFSRMTFGLENLRNKKASSVSLFLFFFTLSGDLPKTGGLLTIIVSGANLAFLTQVEISWWTSGISLLVFYALFFKSIGMEKSYRAASRKAISCVWVGLLHICTDRWFKKDWKEYMHRHYDRPTLQRAKGFVHLVILVFPSMGFIFFLVGKWENLYSSIPKMVEPSGLHIYTGVANGLGLTVYLSMILTYFLLIPALSWIGFPIKHFNYQFSLGYLCSLVAMYYAALVLKLNERYEYDSGIGYVRIYNSRTTEVRLISQDLSASRINATVPPLEAIMVTYVITESFQMVLTTVMFDSDTNLTTFFRIQGKTCLSYAIVDPPDVVMVTANVPLFEGPPQTNDDSKPRIYLFNGVRALGSTQRIVRFQDLSTGKHILSLVSVMGRTDIFQLPPSFYEVRVGGTDLHLSSNFKEGGLYGILLLADFTASLLRLDTVVPGKTLGSAVFTGFAVFLGISLTMAYVTLRVVIYNKAPNGLLNSCFGYQSFQENMAVWILVFGYNTWHEIIWGDTLLTYCFVLTFLFFISVFIMIKYNQFYE